MIPPHLPPQTCSIEQHHRWQRLKIILVASFFGILAGLAGAAVFFGWLWPTVAEGDFWVVARQGGRYSREQLITIAENKMKNKIFSVYRERTIVGGVEYFSPGDKITEGVLAISDGWILAYLPNFDGVYRDWTVLSSEGTVYRVARALADPRSGFIYIKIVSDANTNTLLSTATFSTDLEPYNQVFIRANEQWVSSIVEGVTVHSAASAHLDGAPVRSYLLSTAYLSGSLVIDEQGNVLGFVDANGLLRPVTTVLSALSGIEEKTKITYRSLGVEGWFSSELPLIVGDEPIKGFLVNKIVGKTLLKKGDIITHVNGRAVDYDHVLEALQKNEVTVKVRRGDKTEEFTQPVIEI